MIIRTDSNYFLLNKEDHSISKADLSFNVIESFSDSMLKYPSSLAWDGKNQIAITNSWGRNVILFDAVSNTFSLVDFRFEEPFYCLYDNQQWYILDRNAGKLFVFDQEFNYINSYPEEKLIQLYSNIDIYLPVSVCIIKDNIYLSQTDNMTAFTKSGIILFQKKNKRLFDLTVTDGKHLYVLNATDNKIDIYGQSGVFLQSLNLPSQSAFQGMLIEENSLILTSLYNTDHIIIPLPDTLPEEIETLKSCASTPYEKLILAEHYFIKKDYDTGLEIIESILKVFPGWPPAMHCLENLKNTVT